MFAAMFPSRTLTLYLARLFITRILGVLILLVLVLQMLDLLSESGSILAVPGNGQAEILYYVSLRMPQLIARFLPYSVLLATLFTFWPLNQNSEVIAMRAAGLSAHQVLAPMLLTASIVSLGSFAFNEAVVANATGTLKQWSDLKYAPIPRDTGVKANVYLRDGSNILTASTVTGDGEKIDMTGASLVDSSGLSVADLLTAKTLDEVVNAAAGPDHPALRPMVDMLPVAGGSGTLSNRFYEADAKKSPAGMLRAKTGSLTKTNSLAGIVTDLNGRVLTFAFISNNAGFTGRTAIDALAGTLRTCGCG